MGKSIAFYAPLKSPNHPIPSGDRTIARGIISALQDIDWVDEIVLMSELRSRDGLGSDATQNELIARADAETTRILRGPLPDAWVTYHNYYKAPDLIGPEVCKRAGLPYFVIEASKSPKRAKGPWSEFAQRADLATNYATAVFYLTNRDLPQLAKSKPAHQTLVHLRPFLDQTALPNPKSETVSNTLLAVGMFRSGDKMASFKTLANALQHVKTRDWQLNIVGAGPCEDEVKASFARFRSQVHFVGELDHVGVMSAMQGSDVFVWPGVNEAFGMVYLEAQSVGLCVVAEDRPGVRDVVSEQCYLVKPNDPKSFAESIDNALKNINSSKIREFIATNHMRSSASITLANAISPHIGGTQ